MRSANLAFVLDQAADKRQKHAIGKAVKAATEANTLVPSILRQNLKKAGFKVEHDEKVHAKLGFSTLKHLSRVVVLDKDGLIVAMGASSDPDDALLHAMLGWFRENALPGSDVPAGVASQTVG